MVQKRETKAINKLCIREILSLSFVCGAYFFEFRGRNLVFFVIAYNFNGKYAPEAGKTRMCTAFFTRVQCTTPLKPLHPPLGDTWGKRGVFSSSSLDLGFPVVRECIFFQGFTLQCGG